LGISHEILQVLGFTRAEQTSDGESKINYILQKQKTSQHKKYKSPKPNNEITQTHHTKQTSHNILKNTIMLFWKTISINHNLSLASLRATG
jgi:hypothetical protein